MYHFILLTLDGSALAEQALPHAVGQAERFGAELIILRVLEPLSDQFRSSPAVRQAQETINTLAQEYLEKIATSVQERDIPVRVVSINGRPHEEIVRFAETNQVDLIVMSTRGQSGLSRWLMGSVADRVVRGASVPVLLVPAREKNA